MESKAYRDSMKIALACVLFVGLMLRMYNLDFPSIGYHNMKENEYLSMAQEMQRTKDLSVRKIYFYNAFGEGTGLGDRKELPLVLYQLPMVSYQILGAWRLFGENLWGARLVNVLFGVASILVMYLLGALLLEGAVWGLVCAFLLACMPLAVFFSRNLQPESPAFFFMLAGSFWYLKALKTPKALLVFLGSLAFMAAGFYKMSFMCGLAPLLLCVPLRHLFKHKAHFVKLTVAFLLPYAAFFLVMWSMHASQWKFSEIARVNLFEVFTREYVSRYGKTIWWYASGENFTILFVALTALGVVLACVRKKGILERYIIGWVLTMVVYAMVFSDFINQHNYYQMPFLLLVCLASSYVVASVGGLVKKLWSKDISIYLALALACAAVPFVKDPALRMFGTVFLGEDVAGETLKELTAPGERIFLMASAQGYGIARYARRPVGWVSGFEEFKKKESQFAMRYLGFYPADMAQEVKRKDPAFFEYIRDNYHVKEVGLSEEPKQVYYVILEKGKGSDAKDFLTSFSGAIQLRTIYRLFGRYVFFYSLRPPA